MPDPTGELHQVTVLRCGDCGTLDPGPRELCVACGGEHLAPHDVPGDGTLVSWTLIRKPPTRFKAEGPYAVAVVDLAAGVRLTGRLTAALDALEHRPPATGSAIVFAGMAGPCHLFAEVLP